MRHLLALLLFLGVGIAHADGYWRSAASAVGTSITSACSTANAVLYNAATPCDGTNLLYTTASGPRLQVGSTGTSAGIIAGYSGITGVGGLWASTATPSTTNGLYLDSTGRVGIGTTGPNQKLHLQVSSGNPFIQITGAASNTGGIYFGDDASAVSGEISYVHANDRMDFYTAAGTADMSIMSGNVGIGTTNPTTGKLVVSAGTATADVNAMSWTQTWDEGSTTFTGSKGNVTVTAAANGSKVTDLQVNGGSVFAVTYYAASVAAAVGATATATNLIPAKCKLIGIATRVTTGLGASTGTTGYAVGDGVDPNRWGDIVGTIAGTSSGQADATADPSGWFTAANNVVLTAAGGNFDGTGVIRVVASCRTMAAPTS